MSYWSNNPEWEAVEFISDEKIAELLKNGESASDEQVSAIIQKARQAKGLTIEEVAALIQNKNEELTKEMFSAAGAIKKQIYGKRVVLFAPLYISDHCINDCAYCGYCVRNKFNRRKLTMAEIVSEVKVLESMGHKRLAVEAGEHPGECPVDYVIEALKTIYSVKMDQGAIRRCNVNVAATTVEDYKKLQAAGIGTYILFQETYHRASYAKYHRGGPKSDYDWHTTAHHRAMQAGIDDVGFGALFGLYDWRYEVLGLFLHAADMERRFGVGPHTISVPRIKKALGMETAEYPYAVSDEDFMKLTAIIRLAVPYTGIILSTRESSAMRHNLLQYGVSQVSAGSCAAVGGYSSTDDSDTKQFSVEDHRTPNEVLKELLADGWLPSFCTACYRKGRTGDRFMQLAKTGEIQNVCQPNAILTLEEYLNDYADNELRIIGKAAISRHLAEIGKPEVRAQVEEELRKIDSGVRDLYF
ncbi:MAG: [FeFe] hydrogenase H-cluster radical SAM maturase HydG [Negativicutes bacterium]|jgi:2-iminoacetate synthase